MSNLIFDTEPDTWQELENMVCQAFEEMGYESNRKAEISTARGTVEIDVHAVKRGNPIPTVVLCECKHWNKRVDKSVILSFRSICSDAGAHFGLIVSKEGFQSGAMESREHTNIHLLNFAEFQKTFFDEWIGGVTMTVLKLSGPLRPHIPLIGLKEANFSKIVMKKYGVLFGDFVEDLLQRRKFPVQITDPRGDPHTAQRIAVRSPRQYFEVVKEGCEGARRYFCNLRK
jgi:hypothetical protein